MKLPYLDTSAFAKWYVNESGSEAFTSFMSGKDGAVIGRLGLLEFRCLLSRRRRSGSLSEELESETYRLFQDDILSGVYEVHPLLDEHAIEARALIERLPSHALRTLDALHLAMALGAGTELLATADEVMASAAEDLGLSVERF